MLQWEVDFVPLARIKRTAHDGQGHMCEIKSSGCNICLHRVFSAGFALDLQMTTRKHLLKVRFCSPGSYHSHPSHPERTRLPQNGPSRAPGWVPGASCLPWCWAPRWALLGAASLQNKECQCLLPGMEEYMSFSLGTLLAVHRLPADKLTAVLALYKAAQITGVMHEVLVSSWCRSQNALIHSLMSCKQHSFIQHRALLRNYRDHKGKPSNVK